MLFQTFDEKEKCVMVYKNKKFHDVITPGCTKTWSYASYLRHSNVEYASLYALPHGKSLSDLCPDGSKKAFNDIQKRIRSVFKSASEVGLDLDNFCIYELMPRHLLRDWAEIKNKICETVFEEYEKPKNYEQLLKITKVITDIKQKPLQLDIQKLNRVTTQDKNTYKLINEAMPYIEYDASKTITGRLSTKKGSFPIMTLAKKYRNILLPTHNWLFEMDFNACELRVALALLGHDQPPEDLHDWNLKNVFVRSKDRDNAKKRVFSWLYNPKSKDDRVNNIYDREKLKSLYYDGKKVITPYGREIECDHDHAISYLIQSTAADMVFEQTYKVFNYLEDKKSFIKFCNHDSIMIDLHEDQEAEFHELKEVFSDTRFGKFRINSLGGKDWGNMKNLLVRN